MRRALWRTLTLAACVGAAAPATARAQVYLGAESPRRGSIEVAGGPSWMQGFEIESTPAQLSRALPGERFDLFSTEADLRRFTGAYVRAGVYLTPAISVEGGLRFAQPVMSIRLTGDAESADDAVASQTLSQYVFDGSVLFHLPRAAFAGGRGIPFLSVGAGQLRELHEGRELVETGRVIHGTAGIKYWLGSGRRRIGLRGELGIHSRDGAADPGETGRILPMAAAGLSFLF